MRPKGLLIRLSAWAALAGGLLAAPPVRAAEPDRPASLTVGVVQLALESDLTANRDKMVRFIEQAAAKGCRVVVFPETALYSPPGTARAAIDAAIGDLRSAAAARNVYVIFCAKYHRTEGEKPFERLHVVGPDGRVVQTYDKLWFDARFTNVPGPFAIDGITCCAAICADRWIRGVEELPAMAGAQILFECSNNYANEWIADLGWYWYVPRALRNQAYVVFANTARQKLDGATPGHGHSAVVDPDGGLVVAAGEESDRLLVATLGLSKATRGRALERRNHPLFRPFWDLGLRVMSGQSVAAPTVELRRSPPVKLTIAAAQMACSRDVGENLAHMKAMIHTAKAKGADVVAFPELAVTGPAAGDVAAASESALRAALAELQTVARAEAMCVAFGMPYSDAGRRYNGAFVVGPDGTLLTRYAQLVVDRPDLFAPGTSTKALWFEIKGVPAIVTVGHDALWSEIAELAAVRGAQVHLHLANDGDTSEGGVLRRRQLWCNLASFRTFTATVNAAAPAGGGGSALWEDFHRGSSGRAGGYAPHSAVRLAEAGTGEEVVIATQEVQETNGHLARVTGTTNPQMRPWYLAGALAIAADAPAAATVERWDTFETALTSRKEYANPFRDVELTATFVHAPTGKKIAVPGFYDGDRTWRVRFLPSETGRWTYTTRSADPELNGVTGALDCVTQTKPYLHGPIRADGHHFVHADSTRPFLISTRLSCQFAEPEVRADVVRILREAGVNRVLFMLGGVAGTTKTLFGPGPDYWRYDFARFQTIDDFIDQLRRGGIAASPYFYYFNDKVQHGMTPEQDRAFLRYGMARFGAYANVLPVLSNEVEQKFTQRRDAAYNLNSQVWANEMGPLLKRLAVFGQAVTVHNPQETERAVRPGFYTLLRDWPFPWADYMLRQAQVGSLGGLPSIGDDVPEHKAPTYNDRAYARHNELLIGLRRFGIPVVNEEPGYEMAGTSHDSKKSNPRPWNSQTTDTLRATFWTAVTAGAYAMWGSPSTYDPADPRQGLTGTETPKQLKVLREVMARVPYSEMAPANDTVAANPVTIDGVEYRTNFALAKSGVCYLVYSRRGGPVEVTLAGGEYAATREDPRTGAAADLGPARGGPNQFQLPPESDWVVVIKARSRAER